MGLKYATFHWFVHFLFASLIIIFLKLDFSCFLVAFFSTIFIDLDHLPFVLKKGLKEVIKFSEPKKYFLHNFIFLFLFFLLSFLPINLSFRIIFLSFFIHLLWDLLEDVLIFKMGIKHWLF
jgi:hypothetical protein